MHEQGLGSWALAAPFPSGLQPGARDADLWAALAPRVARFRGGESTDAQLNLSLSFKETNIAWDMLILKSYLLFIRIHT